ncbi:MAG: nitrous oxide-stimulated promoter family protein [Helicobacteraceae bacterium]|nr:nitrous oxide-stimulated promoter family protein [Helicobacteraceae bacterium]
MAPNFGIRKKRAEKRPLIDDKPFRNNRHIFTAAIPRREKIRAVMRFAGKRMLFSRPILAVSRPISSLVKKPNSLREFGRSFV